MILQNDRLMVAILPEIGGRVTRLVDQRTGRDWMAQGGDRVDAREDAAFLAEQAGGWDECFPTVSPWDASDTVWGRQLRDHGDIWGRPMTVTDAGPDWMTVKRETSEYSFARTLRLDAASLVADYAVENLTGQPMPYLWAMHMLLATGPGDRICLAGIDRLAATYVSLEGSVLPITAVDWPAGDGRIGFPLDHVQAAMGFAGKFYAPVPKVAIARVMGATGGLQFGWDGDQVGHLGLWLGCGGWPTVGQVHQIAIEPTTASADHLGQAMEAGQAVVLHPGQIVRWSVRLTMLDEGSPWTA